MKRLGTLVVFFWFVLSAGCDGLEDAIDSEAGDFWQSFPLVKDSDGTILGNAVQESSNQVTVRTKSGYLVQIRLTGTFGDGTIYFADDSCSENPASSAFNQIVSAKTVYHSNDIFYVASNATDGFAQGIVDGFDFLSQVDQNGCQATTGNIATYLPLATITRAELNLPESINGPLEVVYGDD